MRRFTLNNMRGDGEVCGASSPAALFKAALGSSYKGGMGFHVPIYDGGGVGVLQAVSRCSWVFPENVVISCKPIYGERGRRLRGAFPSRVVHSLRVESACKCDIFFWTI